MVKFNSGESGAASTAPTAHIYHRALDPDGQDSLAKLARLVRPDSQILDLGAGPGVLGRYLAEDLGCKVDGVECNPAAVAAAQPWYRRLKCADLEQIALADCFADCRYDFIICADILEHLRRPGALLAQLPGLLAPGGQILASVPNVAYAGLIAELLAGDFRYRSEGLLDETHLRFFTLTSLNRLLEQHGLRMVAVDAIMLEPRETEFADRYFDALPPGLARGLLGRPEALAYQFIVTAMIASQAGSATLPLLTSSPPELRFACQLFWRPAGAEYRENESSVAWGRLGVARQTLTLPVPARPDPPATLRLDWADRPGLLHLHALTLHDTAGRRLWTWDGRRDSLTSSPGQQVAFADLQPLAAGVAVLLAGEDPGLDLPISPLALRNLQAGGTVRVELSWPMSLDYLALVQDCIPRQDAAAAQAMLAARVAELEGSRAALAARVAELEGGHATLAARKAELETERAELAARNADLERQRDEWQDRFAAQATELAGLQTQPRRSWRGQARIWLRRWRHRS